MSEQRGQYVSIEEISFDGCAAIVPTLSLGNVGQLTCDVLICTFQMKRVGYYHHEDVLPFAAAGAFDDAPGVASKSLSTAMEVFKHPTEKLFVVQRRAPVRQGCNQRFAQDFTAWLHGVGCSEIIALHTGDSSRRFDSQLNGPPFRYVLHNDKAEEETRKVLDSMYWVQLEDNPPREIYVPEEGVLAKMIQECGSRQLKAAMVLAFVAEGDNTMDAMMMSSCVLQYLTFVLKFALVPKDQDTGKQTINWKTPTAWQHIQGPPTDPSLFL
eukprot:GFYU01003723.1.p1 GENE.GFYU01003723.1~~GFYU01003723.1.p1  ORF type:complete len:302 (-),score=74.47 GFYU01003723.1:33-839(-)